MRCVTVIPTMLSMVAVLSGAVPQSGGAAAPALDACALLTKADVQKATGRSDAMRFPSQSDRMPGGHAVCTLSGGGDLDIELIVDSRTVVTPLSAPKGAETIAGLGAGAYLQSSPGNVAIFTINSLTSPYALHVGLQSKASAQEMRTMAIAIAQAALARLK